MKRPLDLPVHEFIDLEVDIKESTDPNLIGLSGRIIDETKNTFRIERSSDGKRIIVQKSKNVFEFNVEDQQIAIKGDDLTVRPQDRIKKLFHKRKQLVHKVR
jgi:ribonuclease P protein subunit POP4